MLEALFVMNSCAVAELQLQSWHGAKNISLNMETYLELSVLCVRALNSYTRHIPSYNCRGSWNMIKWLLHYKFRCWQLSFVYRQDLRGRRRSPSRQTVIQMMTLSLYAVRTVTLNSLCSKLDSYIKCVTGAILITAGMSILSWVSFSSL